MRRMLVQRGKARRQCSRSLAPASAGGPSWLKRQIFVRDLLEGGSPRKVPVWVNRCAGDANFVMQVRRGYLAGAAHGPEGFAAVQNLATINEETRKVSVIGLHPAAVIHHD